MICGLIVAHRKTVAVRKNGATGDVTNGIGKHLDDFGLKEFDVLGVGDVDFHTQESDPFYRKVKPQSASNVLTYKVLTSKNFFNSEVAGRQYGSPFFLVVRK